MPKTKLKPGPKPKPRAKAPPPPRATSPSPPLQLDKALVLKIIVAKLEASKTADWHALAASLGQRSDSKGKGTRGKAASATGLTGTQIHSMYHNVIFPALKYGRALWVDEATEEELGKIYDEVEEDNDGNFDMEEGGSVEMEEGWDDTQLGASSNTMDAEGTTEDEPRSSLVPEEDDDDQAQHQDDDGDGGEVAYLEESQVKVKCRRMIGSAPVTDSDGEEVEEGDDGIDDEPLFKDGYEVKPEAENDDSPENRYEVSDDDDHGPDERKSNTDTKRRATRAAAPKSAPKRSTTKSASKTASTKRKAGVAFEGTSARTKVISLSSSRSKRSICSMCLDPIKPGEVTCGGCGE